MCMTILLCCLAIACSGAPAGGVTTAQGSWSGDAVFTRIDCATRAPLTSIAPSTEAVQVGIAPSGEAVVQYVLNDGRMTRVTCNLLLTQSGAMLSLATPAFCTDANAEYVVATGTEAGGVLVLDTEVETMAATELRCRTVRHTLTRR